MKEFAGDPKAQVHPQTVIEHFGTWNAAKRTAGLMPRRFATREELAGQLRRLGDELGAPPAGEDPNRGGGPLRQAWRYRQPFGAPPKRARGGGFEGPGGGGGRGRGIAT